MYACIHDLYRCRDVLFTFNGTILLDMLDLESTFEVLEGEVKEITTNKETLQKNLLDLTELQHILHKTQTFFREVHEPAQAQDKTCDLSHNREAAMHYSVVQWKVPFEESCKYVKGIE